MRIKGKCPMCGNENLITLVIATADVTKAGETARIHCSWPDCPRPMAADEILNLDMAHKVKFTDSGFSVEHTLAERLLGVMLECPLHEYLEALGRPPVPPGRYYAIEDGNTWFFQRIEGK